MSKKVDDKRNVVLVGGGYANIHIVNFFEKTLDHTRFNLVLINPRPYYLHQVSALRMVTVSDEQLVKDSLIPYDRLGVELVQGKAVAIEEAAPGKGGAVVLESGDRIEYAALVLATGSRWFGTTDFGDSDKAVHEHINAWRQRIAKAKSVVIVGGGAVGIEQAGEIRDAYPTKKITIIHGGKLLLNGAYPDKFRKNIERRVRERGIDVITSDYVDSIPEHDTARDLTTRNGKVVKEVDLFLPAFGSRPNAEWIASLGAGVLSDGGRVKTLPTLEVAGHPGVFALGDILEWPEQKQAGKVAFHAGVVAPNLVSFLGGKPQKKVYKGTFEGIIIPIGKLHGALYFDILWGITLGAWVTSLFKGKTLFIPMAKEKLHYK